MMEACYVGGSAATTEARLGWGSAAWLTSSTAAAATGALLCSVTGSGCGSGTVSGCGSGSDGLGASC